MLYIFCIGNSN